MIRALVLHAHPDDELLFAGAYMLSKPDWEWTTVSLTAGPRAKDYRGLCLGFPDEWRLLNMAEYREWEDAVRALNLKPDIVVTHNRMGEYGHPHHMAVHQIAHDAFRGGDFQHFYVPTRSSVGAQFIERYPWRVEVTPAKEAQFVETYGQSVLDELTADKPFMISDLLYAEWFT